MKKIILLLIATAMLLPAFAQKKNDTEKDEIAIKTLLKAELEAYQQKDWEKYQACYLLDDATTIISINEGNYHMTKGWNEYGKAIKASFETGKGHYKSDLYEQNNFKINVQGNTAYASLIEATSTNFNGQIYRYEQVKTTSLIKKGGKWKISCMTIVKNPFQVEIPVMTDVQKHQRNKFMMSYMVIVGANYAKDLGKTVEEYGKYLGDQAKTTWNVNAGFEGFVRGMIYNMEAMRLSSAAPIQIIKKNESFFQCKVPWDLRKFVGEKIHNITFDELMKIYEVAFNTIAEHLGAKYQHKLLDDNKILEITITKNTN